MSSSFILRTLNMEEDEDASAPAVPLETFLASPAVSFYNAVSTSPYTASARRWGLYLGGKVARYSWVFGTSMLVTLFPLFLEMEREATMNTFEQDQIAMYAARGYSTFQIESMRVRGELGVQPAPPPLQPGFP